MSAALNHFGVSTPEHPEGKWTCRECKRSWLNGERSTCLCNRVQLSTMFKLMGMDVVVSPAIDADKIALVQCTTCYDYGLVHIGPLTDLCPAVGCTARNNWRYTNHGWKAKDTIA